MKNMILRFIREEDGQDLVEYAFLLVFIALALVLAVNTVGTNVLNIFGLVNTQLASAS